MKTPDAIPKKEMDTIKAVLQTDAPTNLQQNCYNRLKLFLKREPTESEIGNMMTDSTLIGWAINDL